MQEESGGNDASRCNSFEDLPLSVASSSSSRNKIKKNDGLSDDDLLGIDLLGIICEKLNFDDIFQFAGVCRSWRLCYKTFWKTFMESKSPFIVQKASYAKKSLSFISIPDRKSHSVKMDKHFWGFSYCGSSSGYLIFTGPKTLLLMNPFKRRQKEVSTLDLNIESSYKAYRALLAFVKGSEEFVIVFYSNISLSVYQSQNYLWATYFEESFEESDFVDVAVFHNAIYVLTSDAMIGVLNLGWSSVDINFLQLGNTPKVNCAGLRLVKDDDKLRVVHFAPEKMLDVYEIDFPTMEYVKLNTLGDLALFYSPWASCYALRNPSMWGYYSNHVYSICGSEPKCEVYSWSNNLVDFYPPVPNSSRLNWRDWCFRNLHDEVEHSLLYESDWWTMCLP